MVSFQSSTLLHTWRQAYPRLIFIKTEVVPSNTLWPFKTQQEAALMRYYVTDLTPWFDHSDTIKHFGSVLPTLAVTCPPLLNAIFAIASQHLSLMGKLDSSISLHYQDECFRTLLPDLKTKAFEAPMLAAVSIIRITVHMTSRFQGFSSSEWSSNLTRHRPTAQPCWRSRHSSQRLSRS